MDISPDTTNGLPELKAGVYRHHKGHTYQVLGYACNAQDHGDVSVIYLGLTMEDASCSYRFHSRVAASDDPDIQAFFDVIDPTTGEKYIKPESVAGKPVQPSPNLIHRFEYLGATVPNK